MKKIESNQKQSISKTLYESLEDFNNNFISLVKGKDLEKLLPSFDEFKDKFKDFILAIDSVQSDLNDIQSKLRKCDLSVDVNFDLSKEIDKKARNKLYTLNNDISSCLGSYQSVVIFLKSLVTDDIKRFEGVSLCVIRHPRLIQAKHDEIEQYYSENLRFQSSQSKILAVMEFIEWLIGTKDEFNVEEY